MLFSRAAGLASSGPVGARKTGQPLLLHGSEVKQSRTGMDRRESRDKAAAIGGSGVIGASRNTEVGLRTGPSGGVPAAHAALYGEDIACEGRRP